MKCSWGLSCVALLFAAIGFAQTPQFVAGRILLQFRPEVTEGQAATVLSNLGARQASAIGNTGVRVLNVPVGAEQALLRAFQQRPEVNFAELDRIFQPSQVVPNDPWYTYYGQHLKKIGAPQAWSSTTGGTIIVAVLDTGITVTHEDLSSKLISGWNTNLNTSDTRDVYGHGTKVAGVIAAATNNGLGMSAVCWGCWIMPVKISDDAGRASASTAANGIIWAADRGARVANLSYSMSSSTTIATAARYLADRGGILTVSSGNDGTFDSTPDNPNLLTVGATDSSDVIYSWSNRGNNVDLVAPGCVGATTSPFGDYTSACGTSFSAPIVAGVAALLFSANPGLTTTTVTSALRNGALDLGSSGWDSTHGWGRVDAAKSMSIVSGVTPPPPADTTPPSISILSPVTGSTVSGTIVVQTSATDNVAVTAVEFFVNGNLKATLTAAPYNWNFATTGLANGVHTITAKALDAARNTNSATVNVTVSSVTDTQPPTVSIRNPSGGAKLGNNVNIDVFASDNDRVAQVQFFVNGALIGTTTVAPYTVKWNTQRLAKGAYSLQCRAVDPAGNAALSAPITVYK